MLHRFFAGSMYCVMPWKRHPFTGLSSPGRFRPLHYTLHQFAPGFRRAFFISHEAFIYVFDASLAVLASETMTWVRLTGDAACTHEMVATCGSSLDRTVFIP